MQLLTKHITSVFLLFFIVIASFAQEVEFNAAISNTNVKTGDRFQVQFQANGNISNFKAPNLSNFRVLSGPNQSTQMSWVNGKTTSTVSYSYTLMAIKEGDFTIGPAVCSINGEAYKTNSLKISVGKGVNVNQSTGQGGNTTQKANTSDDMYITCSVNKSNPYLGEQIIATYKFYTRVQFAGYEQENDPKLNGFWKQKIDIGQSVAKTEIIGGYRWLVYIIEKDVLFPQRTGELIIDPLEFKFIVQQRSSGAPQSIWEQIYGRVENIEYNVKSKPVKIHVKPLPENAPKKYNGAVGNLDMKLDLTTNEVKANEAVNVKITLSGKGNIPLIEQPKIAFPSDFEIYDPKITDNTKTESTGVSGSKVFDYLVIPRHAGKFKLDPVEFSYFNPTTKIYQTITSDPIEINVLKSDGSASDNVVYSSNKEDIQVLGNDIRYIHTDKQNFSTAKTQFYDSWSFYLMLLLSPILFIITFIFRNKIRAANRDIVKVKSKKAGKVASKLLSSAKKSLDSNDKKAFYEAISKALFGYISDKLTIPVSDLNQSNIKEKLIAIHVDEQTTQDLMDTIELCDMARFAPVSVSEQEIYNKAGNIINRIEQEVKS